MIDLKTILIKHPDCLSSRATFRSLLLDIYPNERRIINILVSMYESGIVRRIQRNAALSNADVESILSFLENEYGISAKYAIEAIHIWANAFDAFFIPMQEKVQEAPLASTQTPNARPENISFTRQERPRPVRSYGNTPDNSIAYTQQKINPSTSVNEFDWETSILPSGQLQISKFVGIDDAEIVVPSTINGRTVAAIGGEAFTKCIGIKRIIISEGISEIHNGAFSECTSLTSVYLPSTLKFLGSNDQRVKKGVFEQTGLEEIILPKGLMYIAPKAFKHCQKLHTVQIPNTVVEICAEAFLGCVKMNDIFLPDSLLQIGENAFSKTSLVDVYLPEGIKAIAKYTFYKCSRLKNVSLPDSIERIDDYAFSQSGLLSIYIPDKVLSLGSYSFYQCQKLKDVSLPQNLKEIGEYSFSQTAIVKINIPGTVDMITQNAFSECSQLVSVAIFEGVKVLTDLSFDNCAALKEMIIPMSVTKIGVNAFKLLLKKSGWYNNKPDRTKNKNLIIACYPGSYGLEYARKNSYKTKAAVYPT